MILLELKTGNEGVCEVCGKKILTRTKRARLCVSCCKNYVLAYDKILKRYEYVLSTKGMHELQRKMEGDIEWLKEQIKMTRWCD